MSNAQVNMSVRGLTKVFELGRGKSLTALNNINLDIMQGEILGLVGESGCGKSTLGKTLIKLHTESSGTIAFNGEDISGVMSSSKRKPFSRQVQMIFQDPYSCLNPRMTVEDIIAEGPDAHGMWSKDERREKVIGWLERVGLHSSHISRYPHEFSGGQRQRIGIARALALEPKLVICDEPISALDVSVQAQVITLLKQLQVECGLTYLFIAHDLSMVRVICDRMAVMYLGSIVELGSVEQVYDQPKHPYTQALVNANPLPDPVAERARARQMIRGEINSPINVKPGCLFASRCPHVMEKCRSVTPVTRELAGSDRRVACHLMEH
jgi:oligopeptide transport system ATP-binding protein